MGYDKEHLSKLLEFVRMLYNDPANAEFAQGLRSIVGSAPASAGGEKLDKIEKYLALDYGLDTVVNPEYSFIKDDKIRDTLNADWREMMRFRHGLRGHKVDFGEYARFAELQMEMLVNMYYVSKYGNDESILKALQTNAEYANLYKGEDDYKELVPTFLSMKAKVDGLKFELNLAYWDIKPIFDIIKIRNGESHRSPDGKNDVTSKLMSDIESSLGILIVRIKEAMTY